MDRNNLSETPLSSCEQTPRTILYVEDESFVREATRQILESAGYQIWKAANAAEALQLYRANGVCPDLLLTDVVLPGESGCELAAKLRLEDPGLEVLFVTGYPDRAGSLAASDENCLVKPFSSAALLSRVKQALEYSVPGVLHDERTTHACGSV